MSSSTQARREGSGDRRTAILTAAAQLIRQRGFAQVGIDDIGASLGLSGPALYRYFDSKQTLLAQIVVDHLQRIEEELTAQRRVDHRSRRASGIGAPDDGASPRDGLIRALVNAATREPNAYYVLARCSTLLSGEQLARVRERRDQLGPDWGTLLPPVHGGDAWSELGLRTRAITGALVHLSLARTASRSQRSALACRVIADLSSVDLRPGEAPVPQSPPASELAHVNRREAILAVAIPLFSDRGYAAVSLSDIGSRLGITGSAVARQFGSKEDLLATAILRGSEQISAGVALALRRSPSATEAARAMLASYVALAVDFPELVAVQNIEPYALSEQYRSERRKRHRGYIDELAHVIELTDPVDGRNVSRLRAGAAFAAVNQPIVDGARARAMADSSRLLRVATSVALPREPTKA